MAGRPKVNKDIENIDEVSEIIEDNVDTEKEDLIKKNKEQEEIIESLKNENKETTTTLETLQKQMQDMQRAFIQMQSQKSSDDISSDRQIEIGCRFINGVTLFSPKREIERELTYDKTIEVSENEMNMLLKSSFVKKFIEEDVIYFKDKNEYKYFKIYEHLDLDDDKLIDMLTKYNSNDLIAKLNVITRNKKEDALMHSLFYRIVDLDSKNLLNGMKYENRRAIEQYYKFKIETAQMLIDNIKAIK